MALDAGDIDAIAERVLELMEDHEQRPRLLDASQLARFLGVRRSWVYEHAQALGAVRLGAPTGRLRFEAETALRALKFGSDPRRGSPPRKPAGRAPRRRSAGVDLLAYES